MISILSKSKQSAISCSAKNAYKNGASNPSSAALLHSICSFSRLENKKSCRCKPPCTCALSTWYRLKRRQMCCNFQFSFWSRSTDANCSAHRNFSSETKSYKWINSIITKLNKCVKNRNENLSITVINYLSIVVYISWSIPLFIRNIFSRMIESWIVLNQSKLFTLIFFH